MMTQQIRAAGWQHGVSLRQAQVGRSRLRWNGQAGTSTCPAASRLWGSYRAIRSGLNSLPVAMAVSPNGRWVVTVNGGYGSYESGYMQSLAVLDTQTRKVVDYPDPRTLGESKQVLFSGLAFSEDGKRLYGSIVSATDPTGKNGNDTGSGIQVYGFADGKLTWERVIKIPLQKLAPGRITKLVAGSDGTLGLPYPAAILTLPGEVQQLLVADNLSDDVLLVNAASGKVTKRFDLSESNVVPGTYPIALAVSKEPVTKGSRRAFVGLWNSSEVVELDLVKGTVGRKLALLKADSEVKPSSHPTSLVMAPDGQTVYVSLGNRDAVAAVDLSDGGFRLKGYYDVRLPGQSFYGALPEALAVNADGSRLYVANMGSDAIAVIDTRKLTKSVAAQGMAEPVGFIPTEWMPMGVACSGGAIYIASGKGTGTGPNNFPQRPTPQTSSNKAFLRNFTYIPTLLHGSLAAIDEKSVERDLKALTAEALEDNRMKAAQETIAFSPQVMATDEGGGEEADSSAALRNDKKLRCGMEADKQAGPIKHVIYIIKENRTYDQFSAI